MKRILILCGTVIFLLGFVASASAVSINYSYALSGDGTLTTPYSWVTVETFDGPSLLWTWSGSGEVVSGPRSGKYAAPYNEVLMGDPDPTFYVTVPDPDGGVSGSYAATNLGGTYTYFGIFWGSVDAYNTLYFYNEGEQVAKFTGAQATSPSAANGNQVAPYSNLYINFWGLPEFDSFMMESTNFAFEADNIAVGNVPEPATMLLVGTGIIALAGFRSRARRRKE